MANERKYDSQREFGKAVHSFLDHVKEHDPGKVVSALIVVANDMTGTAEDDGNHPEGALPLHICCMGGGDSELMAETICTALEDLMSKNDEFATAFKKQMAMLALRQIRATVEEMQKLAQHGERSDEMAASLIERMKTLAKGAPDGGKTS